MTNKKIIKKLNAFFAQPGINMDGVRTEAGVSRTLLYSVLKEEKPATVKFLGKIVPVMEKYGFKDHGIPTEY